MKQQLKAYKQQIVAYVCGAQCALFSTAQRTVRIEPQQWEQLFDGRPLPTTLFLLKHLVRERDSGISVLCVVCGCAVLQLTFCCVCVLPACGWNAGCVGGAVRAVQ
jgi:hypothetical protein